MKSSGKGPAHGGPSSLRLLSIPDVAKRLQVSIRTVHRLIANGKLETIHIGRAVRITEEAYAALLTRGVSK